jgi:hypothetical protein
MAKVAIASFVVVLLCGAQCGSAAGTTAAQLVPFGGQLGVAGGIAFSTDAASIAALFPPSTIMTGDMRPSRIMTWWGAYRDYAKILTGLQIEYTNGYNKRLGPMRGKADPAGACDIVVPVGERVTMLNMRAGDHIDYVQALSAAGKPLTGGSSECGNSGGGVAVLLTLTQPGTGEYFAGFEGHAGDIIDNLRPLKAFVPAGPTALVKVMAATPAALGSAVGAGSSFSSGSAAAVARLFGTSFLTFDVRPSYLQTYWGSTGGYTVLQGISLQYTDSDRIDHSVAVVGATTPTRCDIDLLGEHVQRMAVLASSYVFQLSFTLASGRELSCGVAASAGASASATKVQLTGNEYFFGFGGVAGQGAISLQLIKAYASGGVAPTPYPTMAPSAPTSKAPSSAPTTRKPTTQAPSRAPTAPTMAPTRQPTTQAPSRAPSAPTAAPTAPTARPTTRTPTRKPTTGKLTSAPSAPTMAPTAPTAKPTTGKPTSAPSEPTCFWTACIAAAVCEPVGGGYKFAATGNKTAQPCGWWTTYSHECCPVTASPTSRPTSRPTSQPSSPMTGAPSTRPSTAPPVPTTAVPTSEPSTAPTTATPTGAPPTGAPSAVTSTTRPSTAPPAPTTAGPTSKPSAAPTAPPSSSPPPSVPIDKQKTGDSTTAPSHVPTKAGPTRRPTRPTKAPAPVPCSRYSKASTCDAQPQCTWGRKKKCVARSG